MPKQFQTPMSGPVSHFELCHALHTLHRASIEGNGIFKPFVVYDKLPKSKHVYVAYLEERLYIFRKGNSYRMAYGANDIEAYCFAFPEMEMGVMQNNNKPRTVTKHLWHVSSYSPEMGWICEYHGHDAKAARAAYDRAKKIYQLVTVKRDGVDYRRWK